LSCTTQHYLGGIEGRPDRPWRYSIDPNPLLDQMRCKGTNESVHAALGHRIVEEVFVSEESGHRAGHDNGASGLRVRHGSLGHVKITMQVRLQRSVEMGFGYVFELTCS